MTGHARAALAGRRRAVHRPLESRGKAVSDVFGLAALATIMSVVGLGWRSGAGLAPALAGFVHDVTGSYTPSFAFGVLALAAGWTLFRLGSGS